MSSDRLADVLKLTIERVKLRPRLVIYLTHLNQEVREELLPFIAQLRTVELPQASQCIKKSTFNLIYPLTAIKKAEKLFYYPKRARWEESRDPTKVNFFEVEEEGEGIALEDDEGADEDGIGRTANGGKRYVSPFGPRTKPMRKHLDKVAKDVKNLFSKDQLSRGLARFEELLAREDPNKFELLPGKPAGLRLNLVGGCNTRSWPRFFLEQAPKCSFSYGCLDFLVVYSRSNSHIKSQLEALFVEPHVDLSRFRLVLTKKFRYGARSMEEVSTGTSHNYCWEWYDPVEDVTWFDIGYSTNPAQRIDGHETRPVNGWVGKLVELDHFEWSDVKSFIIYSESKKAPAALGFPPESMFNMFFGGTDRTDSRRKGLNVNLLDGQSSTPSITPAETIEIIGRAKEYFESNPTVSLPGGRVYAIHDPKCMAYRNEITEDPDISASTLYALLTGILYPRVARKAYSDPATKLPDSTFAKKVPLALLSRKDQAQHAKYEEEVESFGVIKQTHERKRQSEVSRAKEAKREREELGKEDPTLIERFEDISSRKKAKVESTRSEILDTGAASGSGKKITGKTAAKKEKMLDAMKGMVGAFDKTG